MVKRLRSAEVVNVHDAKTHLSRLLDRVARGEEIVLAKAGKPYARLVPMDAPPERQPGLLRGRIDMDDSFFDELPDEDLRAWEGADDGADE